MGAQAVRVDPTEITNAKWNEVVEWGNLNNYSGLPLGPSINSDFPRTGITFWQAIKWCNARSEMDGLKPAYYTDPEELLGDFNNDGIIQSAAQQPGGGDQFSPYNDFNGNGKWDPGESFTDNNGNGVYDGEEYLDLNGNNAYDPGRTMVLEPDWCIENYLFQILDLICSLIKMQPDTDYHHTFCKGNWQQVEMMTENGHGETRISIPMQIWIKIIELENIHIPVQARHQIGLRTVMICMICLVMSANTPRAFMKITRTNPHHGNRGLWWFLPWSNNLP